MFESGRVLLLLLSISVYAANSTPSGRPKRYYRFMISSFGRIIEFFAEPACSFIDICIRYVYYSINAWTGSVTERKRPRSYCGISWKRSLIPCATASLYNLISLTWLICNIFVYGLTSGDLKPSQSYMLISFSIGVYNIKIKSRVSVKQFDCLCIACCRASSGCAGYALQDECGRCTYLHRRRVCINDVRMLTRKLPIILYIENLHE